MIIIKKLCFFILMVSFLFTYTLAISQAETIQNLEYELNKDGRQNNIDILLKLTEACVKTESKKALAYGARVIDLAEKDNQPVKKGLALVYMAMAHWNLRDEKKSLKTAQEALAFFKNLKYKPGICKAYYQLGNLHLLDDRLDESLENFLTALAESQESENKDEVTMAHYKIGIVYSRRQEFKQAMDYFQKTLAMGRNNNNLLHQGMALNNIGVVYLQQRQYQQALDYYFQAYETFKKIPNENWLTDMNLNIGSVYLRLNRLDLAMKYCRQAVKKYRQINDPISLFKALYQIGLIYAEKQDHQNAILYMKEAIKIATYHNRKMDLSYFYQGLADLFEKMGRLQDALVTYKMYITVKDEFLNETSAKRIAYYQEKYAVEAKNKEIENQKRDLHIERLRRNILVLALIVFLFILIVIVRKFKYFFQFWKKQSYIGPYRLMDRIGYGSYGTIFRAHDIKNKSHVVAIKVLKEELFADEAQRKRFMREAAIIDKLDHPNIVKVIERGENKEKVYIVMEYLKGMTLEEKIRQGSPLDLRICLHLMVQIADALVLIHKQGIIHRDIKPGNMMVLDENGEGNYIKLLDFGISKLPGQTKLTQTGHITGTFQYMSPEHISNRAITASSDVYSLGVVFYEMVSGRVVFFDDDLEGLKKKITGKKPVEPVAFRPELPSTLNLLIMQMLSKKPGSRPSSEEILKVLRSLSI